MRKLALAIRRLVPAFAVTALLVLVLLATSASANSPAASVSFAGNATLVSNPGPVELTLHYDCLPPGPGVLEVGLGENGIFASDFFPATCDGKNHTATVTLGVLFTPGTGAGSAMVFNDDGSASASTTATVAIK